jgi:hypothetical protein
MTTWEESYYTDDVAHYLCRIAGNDDKYSQFIWKNFSFNIVDKNAYKLSNDSDLTDYMKLKRIFPDYAANRDE